MKYTKEQIETMARHAAERAQLVAEQQNARADVEERQRKELADLGIEAPPISMTQPPVAARRGP